MTKAEIIDEVLGRMNLSSTEARNRVGSAVDRHHERVTSEIGLDPTRFVTRSMSTTNGVQTVIFSSIEHIDRVLDLTTASAPVLLQEVSIHTLRSETPDTGAPTRYAIQSLAADSVTIRLDTIPQSTYSLQADGTASMANLLNSESPAFAASFHDIITWSVLAEELLRKEKIDLASAYETKANELLAKLQFHIADSHTRVTRQANTSTGTTSSGGSSGGGTTGGTAYTQTALLTYDLGAGVAPFAVAQATAAVVTNLDADKLDGQHGTYYTNATNLGSGTIPLARISNLTNTQVSASAAIAYSKLALAGSIVNADVNASAAIAWTKVSKSGSSLADLATRSAADLSSGTVAEARLGSGTGTVNKVLRGNSTWGDAPGMTTDGSSRVQQVAFAATQSASADANTLDDYEEGTWTPIDSSGASLSFSTVEAYYVKIGQFVTATMTVTYPSTASGATATIGGLPFTVRSSTSNLWPSPAATSAALAIWAQPIQNTTTFQIVQNTSFSSVSNSTLTTAIVRATLVYRATA